MARYVEEEGDRLKSIPSTRVRLTDLKAGGSAVAQRILRLLSTKARYSHDIARELKLNEQRVYYHVRKLERAGLIEPERREEIQGGSAKYYKLSSPAFTVALREPQETAKLLPHDKQQRLFLEPFVSDGKADFLIIVGSPDPHGPGMARAKDGSYAIDLALFLGSFCEERPGPVVVLDTEFREEERTRNLIIIGGPIVNTVAAMVNHQLPIRFSKDGKRILSTVTGNEYDKDEVGIIVKAKNPYAKEKSILFVAGRRQAGTRAAILALIKEFEAAISGNVERPELMARVVEGKDNNSDGVVDAVEFRE